MEKRKVACASDHAGFEIKAAIRQTLADWGYDVLDLGTHDTAPVDYPDFAQAMAEAFAKDQIQTGILACGSGVGISMAANRFKNLRAVVCHTPEEARLARLHNDANTIAFGGRVMTLEASLACLKVFLATEFEGGRHAKRVAKMS